MKDTQNDWSYGSAETSTTNTVEVVETLELTRIVGIIYKQIQKSTDLRKLRAILAVEQIDDVNLLNELILRKPQRWGVMEITTLVLKHKEKKSSNWIETLEGPRHAVLPEIMNWEDLVEHGVFQHYQATLKDVLDAKEDTWERNEVLKLIKHHWRVFVESGDRSEEQHMDMLLIKLSQAKLEPIVMEQDEQIATLVENHNAMHAMTEKMVNKSLENTQQLGFFKLWMTKTNPVIQAQQLRLEELKCNKKQEDEDSKQNKADQEDLKEELLQKLKCLLEEKIKESHSHSSEGKQKITLNLNASHFQPKWARSNQKQELNEKLESDKYYIPISETDPRYINNYNSITMESENEKCSRCKVKGHDQGQCINKYRCSRCSGEGHIETKCPKFGVCSLCNQRAHKFPNQCTNRPRCNYCAKFGHLVMDCRTNPASPAYVRWNEQVQIAKLYKNNQKYGGRGGGGYRGRGRGRGRGGRGGY
jgi:hypothetical protein